MNLVHRVARGSLLLSAALSLPALACKQRHDYPMTVAEAQAVDISATESGSAEDYVRYRATLVVDEAMQADLDASVAAGCRQALASHKAYGSVTAQGYVTAEYHIGTDLTATRPATGKQWLIGYWNDDAEVGKFGGNLTQTHVHKGIAPGRLAGRAKVGDVVELWSGGRAYGFAFGNPDGIADLAAISYHWGDNPPPVISVWLP